MSEEKLTVIELRVGRLAMVPMPQRIGIETVEALKEIGVRPCEPEALQELLNLRSAGVQGKNIPDRAFFFCLSSVGARSHPCVATDGGKISDLGNRAPRGYDDWLLVEPIAVTC